MTSIAQTTKTEMNEATPLMFSRSSSLTSLNSFDAKSLHSSVPSEYSSHAPSSFTSPTKAALIAARQDKDASDLLDEIDLVMPDSPSAQHESSFLLLQRLKHKEQQTIYRQNAASTSLPLHHPQQSTFDSNRTLFFSAMDSSLQRDVRSANDPSKPWTQCINMPHSEQSAKANELTSLVNRLKISSKEIAEEAHSSSSTVSSSSSSASSLVFTNTPMTLGKDSIKPLNATLAPQAPSHTPPVKLMTNAPKFITQATATFLNPAPSSFLQPMSVSYAFLNSSQQHPATLTNNQTTNSSSTSAASTNSTSLPKFLTNNNSYFQGKEIKQETNPFIPSAVNYSPAALKGLNFMGSNSSSTCPLKMQSPPNNDSFDLDLPNSYLPIEGKFRINTFVTNFLERSGNTSPQESVCSRMSEASVPSIIRQEINTKTNHQAKDFSALFSKMKSSNQSNFSPAKASEFNQQEEEQNKLFFSVLREENATQPKPKFAFLDPSKATFIKSNPSMSQHVFYQNYYDVDPGQESRGTYSPKVFCNEGGQSRYSSASSIDQDNELCETKKFEVEESLICHPMATKAPNTPAMLGGSSHGHEEHNESTNDRNETEEQVYLGQNLQKSIQDDPDEMLLENFINEMLPNVNSNEPKPETRIYKRQSLNTEQLSKTNFVPPKSSLKSFNSNKSQIGHSLSKPAPAKTLFTKPATVRPQAIEKKIVHKRLSEENLSIRVTASKVNTISVSNSFQKSSKPLPEKTVNVTPVVTVNMTKTSQLRASKMSSNLNSASRKPMSFSNVTASNTAQKISSKPQSTLSSLNPSLKTKAQKQTATTNELNDSSVHSSSNLNNEKLERRKSFSFGSSSNSHKAVDRPLNLHKPVTEAQANHQRTTTSTKSIPKTFESKTKK